MNHLLISREYPPSSYPRGGIGTYVEHIARLLAEAGETVHVIAEAWDAAPRARTVSCGGRLIVHRVSMTRPIAGDRDSSQSAEVLEAMAESVFPAQAFSWQAALLAESLVETAGIDVIEGQDYEAPLFYLLLRRAAGLGPRRQPPCFVHFHSPWEFVCAANGWGLTSAHDLAIKRSEDYAIASADGWLSPSRYLAGQVERHYGLGPASVECIPYPIGQTPRLDRSTEIWTRGTVCYFGRLEPRKGVLEWIDAAVSVAETHPNLQFDFIGSDTTIDGAGGESIRAILMSRVPAALATRFVFTDALSRPLLWERLAKARMAVVPSRWENFPNTCVEAMCSGLPVFASPNGGMAEMIEDGRTGWIASSGSSSDLARDFRRALDTPPDRMAQMGDAAADAIRVMCDNANTVSRQLDFRTRLSRAGVRRSNRVPVLPPWSPPLEAISIRPPSTNVEGARHPEPDSHVASRASASVGIVVVDVKGGDLDRCLASVQSQTVSPVAVSVALPWSTERDAAGRLWNGSQIAFVNGQADRPNGELRRAGLDALYAEAADVAFVGFVDSDCRLRPTFVADVTRAFADARLGAASTWFEAGRTGVRLPWPPALPYAWVRPEGGPCWLLRRAALDEVIDGGVSVPVGEALVLAILASGWSAVTTPSVLATSGERPAVAALERQADHETVRERAEKRSPIRRAADGPLLAEIAAVEQRESSEADRPRQVGRGALGPAVILRLSRQEQLGLVMRALRHPGYAARWLSWHARRVFRR